jgi:hypothetical protein
MRRPASIALILLLTCVVAPLAQRAPEPVDHAAIASITTEAVRGSMVMDTVSQLADVYGPRLTGSPQLHAAAEWSRDRLTEWGLSNAALEPWGDAGPGWALERFSVEMTAPQYMRITAHPKAWSASTSGTVRGTPTLVSVASGADCEAIRGKLEGAIVMNGRASHPGPSFEAPAERLDAADLQKLRGVLDPSTPDLNDTPVTTYAAEEAEWVEIRKRAAEVVDCFNTEGVAAVLEPSRSDQGIVRVQGHYPTFGEKANYPAFVVSKEHYGRLQRLVAREVPVTIELSLQASTTASTEGVNVIAELPGTDPIVRNEVVMLGAHLDSWHGGTGAADNAVGCAVVMEALRILKAAGLQPRRTIRAALWTGEEQDYYGSVGYVARHFGDVKTGKLKADAEPFSVYFNLDNGAGRIRGINLQGNEGARPILRAWLEPLAHLGVDVISSINTGGTDHMAFDAVGLPGFQFIQDPLNYSSQVHHSTVDTYEQVIPDDAKQMAVVLASVAYHAAMRDERFPRK